MAITIPSQVAFMYRDVQALPALARNTSTSVILQPGEILEVAAPASGVAKVFTATSTGGTPTEVTLSNGTAQSFGPVNTQLNVRVINQPFSAGDASLNIARLN